VGVAVEGSGSGSSSSSTGSPDTDRDVYSPEHRHFFEIACSAFCTIVRQELKDFT
jgi:hypothetical protein